MRPTIVVATTLTTYAMQSFDTWQPWLRNAVPMQLVGKNAPWPGYEVNFFAAIETDARGREPFRPLLRELGAVQGAWWTYTLDDGREEITTTNRLRHIAMGQNLCAQYATDIGATHLLFMGVDCMPPVDVIPALLEMDWPYCGLEVPTFCLTGPEPMDCDAPAPHAPACLPAYEFPVEEHAVGGACLFLRRDYFTRLKFHPDIVNGDSEDYAMARDVWDLFNIRGRTRKDVQCRHFPEHISPIEKRYPDFDMSVHR